MKNYWRSVRGAVCRPICWVLEDRVVAEVSTETT